MWERSPQAKHPPGHVVGPVEARKSRGLAEYEGIKEGMLAGYCKEGLGDVESKGIAPLTVTVDEAGLGNFVLSAFFPFRTERDSALKILFSSSESLAMGFASY